MSNGVENNKKHKIKVALFSIMDCSVKTFFKLVEKRDDLELSCVFTCPGPKSRRSDAYLDVISALPSNIDVIVCNKKKTYLSKLKLYEPDILISMGFPWLLPEDLLAYPRLGSVNFHNSHLPDGRGPNAFGKALVENETEFKFCSHRMDGTFDTGPILVKITVPFEVDDYLDDEVFWEIKILPRFVDWMGKTIDAVLSGEKGEPQLGKATQAPLFDADFRWIDFSEKSMDIHNKVRAFWGCRDIPHGALAKIEGETYCILRTIPEPNSEENSVKRQKKHHPGNIVFRDSDTISIMCGDGVLKILKWHKM